MERRLIFAGVSRLVDKALMFVSNKAERMAPLATKQRLVMLHGGKYTTNIIKVNTI